MGRFLNADAFAATGQGLLGNNMFAYCGNNPVNLEDPYGTMYIYMDINGPVSGVYSGIGGSAIGVSSGGGAGGGGAAGPLPVSLLTLDEILTVVETVDDICNPFGNLSYAEEYGIKPYRKLKQQTKGTGLEAHHIIEQRFAGSLGLEKSDILSVALTHKEHQVFTNSWRRLVKYGSDYSKLTRMDIWTMANAVYHNHPELLKATWSMLFK